LRVAALKHKADNPGILSVAFGFLSLCVALAPAQILIDTVAGGKPRSGVPANDVVLGLIEGITKDASGNVVFCEDHAIRRVRVDGTVETIAGTGVSAYAGDGGPASAASFFWPRSPRFDSNGNLYFIDEDNARIRRIDPSAVITTVAGIGQAGSLGASGPAVAAQIGFAADLAIDSSGSVYLSFQGNYGNQIKRLPPGGVLEPYTALDLTGIASDGDGGPAINAHVRTPGPMVFDGAGNLYVGEPYRVRRISPDGIISSFAGNNLPASEGTGDGGQASAATFRAVVSLAADSRGNVFVADQFSSGHGRIRRISPDGTINTVAGVSAGPTTDGPALQTQLNSAYSLFADASGNVLFSDGTRLRMLTSQNTIQTVAGGSPVAAPDGMPANASWLIAPNAITVDHNGTLYISEPANCTIRQVGSDGVLSTLAGTGECSSSATAGPVATTGLTAISSLAVDSKNRIYAADGSVGPVGATFLNQANIYVISPGGTVAAVPGSPFPPGPPARLAVDSEDRLYILTSTNVLRVPPGSAPEIFLAALPPGPYNFAAIAIDAADNIYLMDVRNDVVLVFGQDGRNSTGLPTRSSPLAIASDPSGNLWEAGSLGIAEANSTLLRDVNPATGSGFFGDGGPFALVRVSSPAGLSFAPNGDLYILDTGNRRVRKTSGSPPKNAPLINSGGIVNALSLKGGAVAPGEMISIFGSNLGPPILSTYSPNNNSVPQVLGNVTVYFNQYAGRVAAAVSGQINVFVPYEVVDFTAVEIIVDIDGARSPAVTVPVTASFFGLATADASGHGQGAILNQDGSYNGKASPASRGSIVTLFGTGEGLSTPLLPDGALTIATPFSVPVAPVAVAIGGITADLLYAGAAPFLPAGVLQVNVRIPDDAPTGDIAITVSIGGVPTSQQVTCAVK
jgi:uncharacterized protein (TIGR03437 family)